MKLLYGIFNTINSVFSKVKMRISDYLSDKEEDEYDKRFGEPTTQVVEIIGVLDYIDEVIASSQNQMYEQNEENAHYGLKADRVVLSARFEEAVKLLFHQKNTVMLQEIKKAIILLGRYATEELRCNPPEKRIMGYIDLPIERNMFRLYYCYYDAEVFYISISDKLLQEFRQKSV